MVAGRYAPGGRDDFTVEPQADANADTSAKVVTVTREDPKRFILPPSSRSVFYRAGAILRLWFLQFRWESLLIRRR